MTSDWGGLRAMRLDSVLIFLMVSDTEANVSAIVMDTDEDDSEVVLVIDSDDGDLDDLERRWRGTVGLSANAPGGMSSTRSGVCRTRGGCSELFVTALVSTEESLASTVRS